MIPNEIYKCPCIRTEKQHLYRLEQYFPEINAGGLSWETNTRLEARYYIDSCFDGERGLAFYSVWFDDQPFMLCQDAGRGNQDYNRSFLTNRAVYQEALNYLITLTPAVEPPREVDPNRNIEDLDHYYGWNTARNSRPGTSLWQKCWKTTNATHTAQTQSLSGHGAKFFRSHPTTPPSPTGSNN